MNDTEIIFIVLIYLSLGFFLSYFMTKYIKVPFAILVLLMFFLPPVWFLLLLFSIFLSCAQPYYVKKTHKHKKRN